MKILAFLLAIAALPLAAQDAYLGARVHGIVPMGDLRDLTSGQIGVGAAAFVGIPLEGGIILRPLVGVQFIPKGTGLDLAGNKTSVASVDLMMEAQWFPGENSDQGPYLVGAVGGQQWRLSTSGTTPSTLSVTRLGASGGLGYQFRANLGFEARGFWSPVSRTITATGLMLGATIRF
ncbi:MAG TPA: hypothetical protein VJ486_01870 [Geothrix sp.]|nr:hypothetical protein [Geothrix sp.]